MFTKYLNVIMKFLFYNSFLFVFLLLTEYLHNFSSEKIFIYSLYILCMGLLYPFVSNLLWGKDKYDYIFYFIPFVIACCILPLSYFDNLAECFLSFAFIYCAYLIISKFPIKNKLSCICHSFFGLILILFSFILYLLIIFFMDITTSSNLGIFSTYLISIIAKNN